MNTFKKRFITAGATLAVAGLFAASNPTEASAEEYSASNWSARTVEQIQNEIEDQGAEGSKYTFQWGDTLSGIASAADISLGKLVKINDINNADLIFVGNSIHLSADHSVVSVEKDDEVVSYDVSEEEVVQVETPKEAEESIKEEPVEAEETAVEESVEQPKEEKAKPKEEPKEEAAAPSGQTMVVEATAYSTNQANLSDTTRDGTNLHVEPNVIAVDPNVIPMGTMVHIPGYGTFRAADTGGAIKGNRIDIHMTNLDDAWAFGRRTIEIQILN